MPRVLVVNATNIRQVFRYWVSVHFDPWMFVGNIDIIIYLIVWGISHPYNLVGIFHHEMKKQDGHLKQQIQITVHVVFHWLMKNSGTFINTPRFIFAILFPSFYKFTISNAQINIVTNEIADKNTLHLSLTCTDK